MSHVSVFRMAQCNGSFQYRLMINEERRERNSKRSEKHNRRHAIDQSLSLSVGDRQRPFLILTDTCLGGDREEGRNSLSLPWFSSLF